MDPQKLRSIDALGDFHDASVIARMSGSPC